MAKTGINSCGSYTTNTTIRWKGLRLILAFLLLLAGYIYCQFSQQGRYLHQIVIMILLVILRNLIKNIWLELPITGLAILFPDGAPRWKVSLTAGFVIFTIGCYCYDRFVKTKIAQLPRAVLNPSWTEDE